MKKSGTKETKKIKKGELFDLLKGLNDVADLKGVKFVYAVAKNIIKLKGEVESLQAALKPSEKFQEYDVKRLELVEKYAKKKNGEAIQEGSQFVIDEKKEKEFAKEIERLRVKYKQTLDEREKQIKDFNDLLNEESDFQPFKVKQEDVPEDITAGQLTGIFGIIEI